MDRQRLADADFCSDCGSILDATASEDSVEGYLIVPFSGNISKGNMMLNKLYLDEAELSSFRCQGCGSKLSRRSLERWGFAEQMGVLCLPKHR